MSRLDSPFMRDMRTLLDIWWAAGGSYQSAGERYYPILPGYRIRLSLRRVS